MLKPGGLFLWGNALPTRVWDAAVPYLNENGFKIVENLNHTQVTLPHLKRTLNISRSALY